MRVLLVLAGLLGLTWSVLLPHAAAQAAPSAVAVLSSEGRRPLPVVTLNGEEYAGLDDLAVHFPLTMREDRVTGGLTVTSGAHALTLTPGRTVLTVDGRLLALAVPPVRQGTRVLVPLDILPRALGSLVGQRLQYRRAGRLVVVGDLRVPRVVAQVEIGTSSARVTVDITPGATATVTPGRGQLLVTLEADALDLAVPVLPTQGFVQALRTGETAGTLAVVTGPRTVSHRVSTPATDAGSTRVVIDLLAADAATAAPEAPATAPPMPAMPGTGAGLRTVVIDPGHGGDELGAQGPGGLLEKTITLDAARRLRARLEARLGLRVLLTREEDVTVAHDDRTAFANNNQADLFISLHANASVRPGPRGAEVYYLSVEGAESERRRVAGNPASRPVPALGGGARTIDLILWETAQARHLEQSAVFAGLVEQALRTQVEMSPRPLQQAPFRVLVGANMPAVLVEMAYVSNPEQEQVLDDPAFLDRIADALVDAIVRFRDAASAPGTRPPA